MAKETTETPKDPTMAEAMAMFAEILKSNAAIQQSALIVQQAQLKQTQPRSLTRPPLISVFNPRGEKDFPMPDLKCIVHMPWPLRPGGPGMHGCTREEVELLNRVVPGEYTVELRDETRVQVSVVGDRNSVTGKTDQMAFMGAKEENGQYSTLFTRETKSQFPAMTAWLRQMLTDKGIDCSDILSMKDEYRRVALPADHPEALAVSVGE